jgi:hypothetical protein
MIEVEDRSQGFCERSEDAPAYLDDYNGYSTDLSRVIGEIGSAALPLRQGGPPLSEQADALERDIFTIMERDNNSEPTFYPGVAERLTPRAIHEYSFCNQAYQHTALIYIRWQLRGLPRDAPEIQDSVKRIIECVSSITPSYGLSPAIVLTTPLFTAGCEALGEDREIVRRLLSQLYERLRIRNIKLALEVLEAFWADENINGYLEMLLRTYHITLLCGFELKSLLQAKRTGISSLIEGSMEYVFSFSDSANSTLNRVSVFPQVYISTASYGSISPANPRFIGLLNLDPYFCRRKYVGIIPKVQMMA